MIQISIEKTAVVEASGSIRIEAVGYNNQTSLKMNMKKRERQSTMWKDNQLLIS